MTTNIFLLLNIVLLQLLMMITHCSAFYLEYCELLDMTYPLNNETIHWPTAIGFSHETVFRGQNPKGYHYESNNFRMSEHVGTHVDAPVHFGEGQEDIADVKPFKLIGEACVVDVSEKAAINPNYLVTVGDLERWELSNRAFTDDCIVIFHTGWGQHWPNKKTYLGTDTKDVSLLHFPGVSVMAAEWLVTERNVKAVGIDTASIDYGQSGDFLAHVTFAVNDIPILENLKDVGKLPPRHSSILATALPIVDGSGSPARVLAYGWNGEDDSCRRHKGSTGARLAPTIAIIFAMAVASSLKRLAM